MARKGWGGRACNAHTMPPRSAEKETEPITLNENERCPHIHEKTYHRRPQRQLPLSCATEGAVQPCYLCQPLVQGNKAPQPAATPAGKLSQTENMT